MKKTIFLTGGTGFLGRHIAATLLRNDDVENVFLLVRAPSAVEAARRARNAVESVAPEIATQCADGRLTALPGDLTKPGLALPDDVVRAMGARITQVIHCAGCVDFGLPLTEARRINLEGTKQVMTMSMEMPRLERVSHIGTAYVAGERNGHVFEDDLDKGQSFGNSYEQAKFEAERYVRSLMGVLPVDVFRPSIIVGHSRTGMTSSFKMLYAPLKAIYHGLIQILPGSGDTLLDVVPVDFVARAVCAITLDGLRVSGRTFHLTAGEENLVTAGEIVNGAVSYFNRNCGLHLDPVKFVPPVLFRRLSERTGGALRRIARSMETYLPYLRRKVVFDNRNTREAMNRGELPRHLMTYYREILNHCAMTNWGRQCRTAA